MIKRDISKKTAIIIAFLLVAIKLVLTYGQSVYLYEPYVARLDDTLMLESAMSISSGNWLGEYNYLTLSKYMFFPVWLSFINALGVPYLMAGQLLWVVACVCVAYAFLPSIKENIWRLGFFCVLLFNPAITAAQVQLRAYRDNIFPALCTLCVAGFIAVALRHSQGVKKQTLGVIIGGLGLGLAWTTREDGKWILAFALCASAITAIIMLKQRDKILLKCIMLSAPYAITATIILAFCTANLLHYGRFILSDFTSAEFTAAYGAMTRVKHANWHPKIAVPKDVRDQLYDYVPELARLEPIMENSVFYNGFGLGDGSPEFATAGYYWALRRAAQEIGVYQSANTAKAYWQSVASQVNKLCDEGTLPSIGKRSSTVSPIKVEYILPTLKETVLNMWRCVSFAEAAPVFREISQGHGTSVIGEYENYLHDKSNSVATEDGTQPYYSNKQKMSNFILSFVRVIYAILTPAIACVAFCATIYMVYAFYKHKKGNGLTLILILGVLATALLRCGMIGYIFVSSFDYKLERIMYLSSAHPLLLIYGFVSLYTLFTTFKFKEILRG